MLVHEDLKYSNILSGGGYSSKDEIRAYSNLSEMGGHDMDCHQVPVAGF